MANYASFEGGPLDEQLHMTPDEAGWPLPGELTLALLSLGTTFAIGRYVKKSESQLTDEQADHPSIGRAATYTWEDVEVQETTYAEPWNEATGEGVDLGRKPAPADWDPRTDYPERFTEGPI